MKSPIRGLYYLEVGITREKRIALPCQDAIMKVLDSADFHVTYFHIHKFLLMMRI